MPKDCLTIEDIDTIFLDLKPKIRGYNPRAQLRLVKKALVFANNAHKGQKRDSGELFIMHPICVVKELIELKADSATLCAAFMHDVVEDTDVKLEQIQKEFGDEIALLVEGVTKITGIEFASREDYTAENIRKVLLATTKDIRVILIKLADRLHNMRTLKSFREEKQHRIATETLQIYAPIAHKLGIFTMKGELEDLSLRYLNPDVYNFLSKKIAGKRKEREKVTQQIIKEIEGRLKEKKVAARVTGRAKYFYSIYKKMQKKKLDFDQVYDLIAIRIITKSIPDCYAALGVIHDLWNPIPKRFKDYISVPKSNGYQSLHTTVLSNYEKIIEVQIRTEQMHNVAEQGIAAHWRYSGTKRDKAFDQRIGWLKQVLEWKMTSDDARDFVESLKVDLFQDEIIVFTPKGDPITLPINASPIDFAYMVHSNVGDKCSQAKVNGKIVPLNHKLRSGDIVEIISRKNAKPSRQWLQYARTHKAKSKIRAALGIIAEDDPKKGRKKKEVTNANLVQLIRVHGKKGQMKLSKCCHTKQHDPIRAFLTKEKKITIHKASCSNIYALDTSREVPVSWVHKNNKAFSTFQILVGDRLGLLADIMTLMAKLKLNITSIHSKNRRDKVLIKIKVPINEKEEVASVRDALKKIKGVVDIHVT